MYPPRGSVPRQLNLYSPCAAHVQSRITRQVPARTLKMLWQVYGWLLNLPRSGFLLRKAVLFLSVTFRPLLKASRLFWLFWDGHWWGRPTALRSGLLGKTRYPLSLQPETSSSAKMSSVQKSLSQHVDLTIINLISEPEDFFQVNTKLFRSLHVISRPD